MSTDDQVNGYGETPAEYWKRRFHETCERLDESGQQVITLWADKRRLRAQLDSALTVVEAANRYRAQIAGLVLNGPERAFVDAVDSFVADLGMPVEERT